MLCGLGAGIGLASAALLRKPLEQLINLRLLEAGLAMPHLPVAYLLSLGLLVWLLITAIGAIAALLSSAALLGRDPLRLVQNDG